MKIPNALQLVFGYSCLAARLEFQDADSHGHPDPTAIPHLDLTGVWRMLGIRFKIRPMTVAIGFRVVLVCYIALLLVGGIIGFAKAGSRISLITSVAFAAALAFCEFVIADGRISVLALQGFLLAIFAFRWTKTRKFMPSGLMVVVTVLAIGAELLLRNLVY